jgi:hypothetical protein
MEGCRKTGQHSWVGLFHWQRQALAARELGIRRDHALADENWPLVWMAVVIDAAFETMKDQWGDLSPDELLERAKRHQLDLAAVKTTTTHFIEAIEQITRQQQVDLGTGDYDEEADRRGEDLASLGDPWEYGRPAPNPWGSDHASGRRGTVGAALLEEVLAIEQTIAQAPTDKIRRWLEQIVSVMVTWKGPRNPTYQDIADALGCSEVWVRKLLGLARNLRQQVSESASASRRNREGSKHIAPARAVVLQMGDPIHRQT